MAFRVFVKTDGKNIRVLNTTTGNLKFEPASRCSIVLHESQELISIDNDWTEEAVLEPVLYSEILDEEGVPLGSTFGDTVDALDKIIGLTYPDNGDNFNLTISDETVVLDNVLQVNRPSDRLGDFTVVRASDASYTDSSGVIQIAPDNVARIDYTNGVAELLTEPQSTNLISHSEDFIGAGLGVWSPAGNSELNTSSEIAPDNASTFTEISSLIATDGDHRARLMSAGMSINTSYTASIFTKKKNVQYYYFRDLANGGISIVDIDTKEITLQGVGHTVKITDFDNGVKKIDVSFATVGTISNNIIDFGMTSTSTSNVSIIPIGDGNYIWGAQLEALPYATSYIPTNGSTVTRLQDVITDGGNVNVINSEEGVLFFEGSALFDTGITRYLGINDGTTSNRVVFYYSSGTVLQARIVLGGVSVYLDGYSTQTDNVKLAIKWKANDYAFWVNGVEVYTDITQGSFTANTLNNINFTSDQYGSSPFFGRTRELLVYNRALTDEELQSITEL